MIRAQGLDFPLLAEAAVAVVELEGDSIAELSQD